MRKLNPEIDITLCNAIHRALFQWEHLANDDIRESMDPSVATAFFNTLMVEFYGKIEFILTDGNNIELFAEFDTPEDESIFILRWC